MTHHQPQFTLRIHHASHEHHQRQPGQMTHYADKGHSHSVYHVVLIISGTAGFIHDNSLMTAQSGLLLIASPGQCHEYRPVTPGHIVYQQVTFSASRDENGSPATLPFPDLMQSLGLRIHLSSQSWLTVPNNQRESLARDFAGVCESLQRNEPFLADCALRHVLKNVIHLMTENPTTESPEPPMDQVKRFLENNVNRNVSLPELAKRVDCSPGHLLRRFKKEFGVTPMVYHQKLRVEAAKKLLQGADVRIGEIADHLGFSDVYYFSRFFRQQTGLSPRAYRQTQFHDKRVVTPF